MSMTVHSLVGYMGELFLVAGIAPKNDVTAPLRLGRSTRWGRALTSRGVFLRKDYVLETMFFRGKRESDGFCGRLLEHDTWSHGSNPKKRRGPRRGRVNPSQ